MKQQHENNDSLNEIEANIFYGRKDSEEASKSVFKLRSGLRGARKTSNFLSWENRLLGEKINSTNNTKRNKKNYEKEEETN